MKLRSPAARAELARRLLAGLKLTAVLSGALLLVLAPLAGRAQAGATDYPSPLYLSGAASSRVTGSFKLVSPAGPGAPATAPTAAAGAAGVLTGTYSYLYTVVDPVGGETAPSPTSTAATVTSRTVNVGSLPTGVAVRIYRQKSSSLFNRVADIANNSSSTYADNLDDATASASPVLPQAQNRVGLSTTGYAEFSPGVYAPVSGATTVTASASATPNGKGWIVDGAGSVTFAAGTWTFQVRTKSNHTNGTAHLVVGLWKVTTSGGAITSSTVLLDPTTAAAEDSTNLITSSGIKTTTFPVALPSFSLAAGDHLYVQFWRRQTVAYSFGSDANRLATLLAYDGVSQIGHPAASTFPNDPTLQTPVDGARTNSSTLTATFSDPDAGDTGTVGFRVCSAAAAAGSQCSGLLASGSSASVANGASANWTISPALADGTHYWQAQATDAAGGQSSWTATRSFTLDTTQPSSPTLQTPADATLTNSLPSLVAVFSDPDAGDTGMVDFEVCSDSGCSTVVASGSSSSVANGASASWTISPALADGTYHWRARANDAAGNQSSWTATRSFTLDTTPPDTTITAGPADPSATSAPSFSFTATEAGSSFQCQLDAGGYGTCTSPTSYTGLSDGSHTFQVKATDPAGNTDATPASFSWAVDTAPPDTTIAAKPGSPSNARVPSFSFTATQAGSSFQCQLDAGGYGACTSPKSYTGLGGGIHTFEVKATDPAGNTDATPASFSWAVDTQPPDLPALVTPRDKAWTNSLRLAATFSDPTAGDTGAITFRVCSDPECANVLAIGWSSVVANGATASWTIDTALADGIYYWQAAAQDAVGNLSGSTATRSFTLDRRPPGPPAAFSGVIEGNHLVLNWAPPAGDGPMASYVLYIDGARTRVFDGATLEAYLLSFGSDDTRTFALAAVDEAGNEGAPTDMLVGVPNLVGLRVSEAEAALAARGLNLGRQTKAVAGVRSALIVAQTPAAPALAVKGSAVAVVLSDSATRAAGVLVIGIASARIVSCAPNSRLSLQIRLSVKADVTVRILSLRGVPLASEQLGAVRAGTKSMKLRLPPSLARPGRYRVIVTATAENEIARAQAGLSLARSSARSSEQRSGCQVRRHVPAGSGHQNEAASVLHNR